MGIRVVIADGDVIFRTGLRAVLDADPSVSVVAEASHASAALACINAHLPDIVVVELDMPLPDGTPIARAIDALRLPVGVVIFSRRCDHSLVHAALAAGVRGLADKEEPTMAIVDCIKVVAAGGRYLSRSMIQPFAPGLEPIAAAGGTLDELTEDERLVLRGLASSKSSKRIAEETGLSVRRVERMRAKIRVKLGLRGANSLIAYALTHNDHL